MRANYYLATLALVAGGMAVGLYLVPRGGELATMYYRSGRLDEARRILEHEMRDGEVSATNVHYALQTYMRLGDVDRAIALLERYKSANVADVRALRVLSGLYRDVGRVAQYRLSLERLEELAPSREQRIELARVYRAAGLYDQWLAMLDRLVMQNAAPPEDYLTVAMAKASRGDREGAVRVLELLVQRHPRAMRMAADELRVSLELDAARPDKALAAARDSIARNPGSGTAVSFAELFVRRERPALALELLDPFADRAGGDIGFARVLVSLEISQGRAASALKRLEALDAAGKLAPSDRNFLVAAALATGKWEAAKTAFERIEFAALWQNSIELMAREGIARNDHALLKSIIARVTPEFREAFPITAAEISLVLGDRAGAKRLADEVARRETLSGGERIALANVYVRLDEAGQAKRLLGSLTGEERIPEYLALELAGLYLKLGLAAEGLVRFEAAGKDAQGPHVRAARSLLEAKLRSGAREWDFAWTAAPAGDPGQVPVQLMTAVFFTAMDNEIYPYAAEIARRLLGDAPTAELRLRYARALALSGDAEGALKIVEPMLGDSMDARTIYGVALIAAVKAGRMRADDARQYIAKQLADENLPYPEKAALVWDLLAIKANDAVLAPLEALVREGKREFVELYAAALGGGRDKKQLRATLDRELRRATERSHILTLAGVAFGESMFDLARPSYQRILRDEPKNLEALKRLGQMAMWRADPDAAAARRYLEAFVANGGDDYQADFILGEAIIQFPDWQRATPHFQRALAKIDRLEKPTLDDLKLRAKSLYRLARFDESVAAYEALLRRHPRDRALRDEYHDVLVEMGRYDRARTLRGPHADRLGIGLRER